MEHCSLDPYEEQLFKVFDSYDSDNNGSLDKASLQQLCDTLQLQEKSDTLIASLLNDRNRTRATFLQFKDALLLLLGNMQSSRSPEDDEGDREVAPKYVVGSKKYGRRSRPRIDDSPMGNAVQRSQSKPAAEAYEDTNFITSDADAFSEEMLREAWRKLGVGEDGFLNQNELVLVCDEIGLNKLADSVIRHLSINSVAYSGNRRISFQELLEALQHDDTWSEFLGTSRISHSDANFIINSDDLQHATLQHIKLGPDGSGYVNHEAVVAMWETAGIASPDLLLHDLGFQHKANIEVQELATMLEKEIRSMSELRIDHTCNPLMALLHAFIAMHQAEIKCLKSILQQLCGEKEKLQFDVSEANKRAALLAQDVDENVLKLEQKTQKSVKVLESRHAEMLRDIEEQCSNEKEQLLFDNQILEDKLKNVEQEEALLRDSLQSVQKYLSMVEGENKELTSRVFELEQGKSNLEEHIDAIEFEKAKSFEAEAARCDALQDKIIALRRENGALQDRNDEMISQIEELHRELQSVHSKSRTSRDDLQSMEAVGLGAKRRNGEAGSDDTDCESARSPRLGKMRKFHEYKEMLDSWGALGDTEDKDCKHNDEERDSVVQEDNLKVDIVQTLLRKYSIDPQSHKVETNGHETYVLHLEAILGCLLLKIDDEHASSFISPQPLTNTENAGENNEATNRLTLQQLQEANKSLSDKCEHLQQGIDLLGDEYERCEDYWQKKLENERAIYEVEQTQSSEKLKEVLAQLADYEAQFLQENKALATIDESVQLEKQYTDLETEYEDFRERVLLKLDDNELLINNLRDQLSHQQKRVQSKEMRNCCVQTSSTRNLANLQWHHIDTFEFPLPKLNNQTVSQMNALSTTSAKESSNPAMPLKTKKNRKLARKLVQPSWKHREWSGSSSDGSGGEMQVCANLPPKVNNSQMEKQQQFQAQCKHMQRALKHQKIAYTELLNTHYRLYHNYHGEIQRLNYKLDQHFAIGKKLQEKLTENDVLVGKLYIENAFLIKNNQRLEQQLQLLTTTQANC